MLGIIIIAAGIFALIYGGMVTFGFIKTDISRDAAIDKRLLSDKSRYFLSRYNAGIQLMIAGAFAIFLGIVVHVT